MPFLYDLRHVIPTVLNNYVKLEPMTKVTYIPIGTSACVKL